MGKFGIGARVMNGGEEGTITGKAPGRRRVRFDEQVGDGEGGWWDKSELTPVEPVAVEQPAYSVGDRVMAVGGIPKGEIGYVDRVEGTLFLVDFVDWRHGHDGSDCRGDTGNSRWFMLSDDIEPAPLTIEPGKFYRTRDGRKAGPTDCWRDFIAAPVDGEPGDRVFGTDGSHRFNETNLDIVAEWVEPEPAPKFKVGDRVWSSSNKRTKYEVVCVGDKTLDVKSPDGMVYHSDVNLFSLDTAPFDVGDDVTVTASGKITFIKDDIARVDLGVPDNFAWVKPHHLAAA